MEATPNTEQVARPGLEVSGIRTPAILRGGIMIPTMQTKRERDRFRKRMVATVTDRVDNAKKIRSRNALRVMKAMPEAHVEPETESEDPSARSRGLETSQDMRAMHTDLENIGPEAQSAQTPGRETSHDTKVMHTKYLLKWPKML